ncbi:thioredoxin family protein [Caldalkalibacillus salinus]|uniref:thioredoxin family protein n=1 Tax=Caldalkalibacillus salinus TaxID=2803787 RepID=UPI001920C520|nr:thioredoxin family protein [Caldalkalibacillus salinus]
MKKVVIFGAVIGILFAALYFVNNASQSTKVEGNPYGKESLHPATANQLEDPLYQNLILPDELDEALSTEEDLYVYFYSPTCEYCKQASPLLIPTAEEENVDLKLMNLLEFKDAWGDFDIEYTPTLIHYNNGEEVKRIVGIPQGEEADKIDTYRHFLTSHE